MSMAAVAVQAREVAKDIPEENIKANVQYLNHLLAPHAPMAKVSMTLVRFVKPGQVAYFLDSCAWPTSPEAVPVKTALLSWVKHVQEGSSLHLTKSVREKCLKDVITHVLAQGCVGKEWQTKAISLAGRLCVGDLVEPEFHCKAVDGQSSMTHELVTFVLAVQHLAKLKLLLSAPKEELTGLGSVDNGATTLVPDLVADAETTLSPKKSLGGSAVSALPTLVPAVSASGVWQHVFIKMEYDGPKDVFVPWPAVVMAVNAYFNGLAWPLDSTFTSANISNIDYGRRGLAGASAGRLQCRDPNGCRDDLHGGAASRGLGPGRVGYAGVSGLGGPPVARLPGRPDRLGSPGRGSPGRVPGCEGGVSNGQAGLTRQ